MIYIYNIHRFMAKKIFADENIFLYKLQGVLIKITYVH